MKHKFNKLKIMVKIENESQLTFYDDDDNGDVCFNLFDKLNQWLILFILRSRICQLNLINLNMTDYYEYYKQ